MPWFHSISESWLFKTFMYVFLAATGGVLGYIMRTIDKKERIVWWRAILEGVGAGFVGVLVLLICQEMKLSQGYTGVIVGVCGWLGANVTIRILEKFVLKKLGLNGEVQDADTSVSSGSN